MYDVTVQKLERRPVLVIRATMRVDELPAFFGQAYGELYGYATSKGAAPDGPPFARYPSMPADGRIEVEAGVTLSRALAGEGRIEASELQGGDAAVVTHIGPYGAMEPAYQAIEAWMREQGREAGGAPWEVYYSDPQQEPDPQKWRTDIVWPLA